MISGLLLLLGCISAYRSARNRTAQLAKDDAESRAKIKTESYAEGFTAGATSRDWELALSRRDGETWKRLYEELRESKRPR